MDFGVVGLEGLVGSDNICTGFSSLATSNRETKQEWNGSELLKQDRSGAFEDDWRSSKLSKTESMLLPQRSILLNSNTTNLFPDGQQQMLSFSCPKSGLSVERISQNVTLPGFLLTSSPYNRTTGYNYENFNSANMHGVFTETRGPFTPSQWMELEHQALIYKYITANVPIPSNLLIPVRKALDSAGISSFSGGFVSPNTLSWGSFHLGFSSNTDPEPGRCRRTDGKKWRCSRDAAADQKYCERHMNRGRHRSRKHVEGQSGHSAAAATSTTTAKPMLTASSESASVVGLHGSSATNSQTVAQNQQQLKNLLSDSSPTLSAPTPLNRMFLNKENLGERVQDSPNLSTLSSKIDLKSKENPFFILKQQSPYQESSEIEFGRVNSDSLLNPSHSSSSLVICRNFNSSEDFTNQQNISQRSIRQFVNDWSSSQSEQTDGLWPQLDVGTDRTQLSISIPVAPIDFTSSTSSPNNEKVTQSPLRFLRDFDSVHMGMGVGIVLNEFNRRQANWIPVPWESSMGGPLGEVLHNCNNSGSECKSSSALNHLAEGWKSSLQLASSPTGVLQKTTFASLSNSSAGSSPRAENHRIDEGASQCSDVLGTRLVHSSSLPAL